MAIVNSVIAALEEPSSLVMLSTKGISVGRAESFTGRAVVGDNDGISDNATLSGWIVGEMDGPLEGVSDLTRVGIADGFKESEGLSDA